MHFHGGSVTHLQPVPDVLAEGPDDREGGRVVVVEGVEGDAPVELALVVDARRLGAQVVDLVPLVVCWSWDSVNR